jgi:hypothetical protein
MLETEGHRFQSRNDLAFALQIRPPCAMLVDGGKDSEEVVNHDGIGIEEMATSIEPIPEER